MCLKTPHEIRAYQSTLNGWSTWRLTNGVVGIEIAPMHGGRIIQYSLGGHEFLWVNPYLSGQLPPHGGLGAQGKWLNWGGDKLWPAPQGWDSPEQWPGPPDAVLDGSSHRIRILRDSDHGLAAELMSREDPRSGIQFTRTISLVEASSIVKIHVRMKNVDVRPRRWGIWSVTQLCASSGAADRRNPNLKTYIPVNAASHFDKGYKVLYGDTDNPQFELNGATGIMRVHYQERVGKIGVDSPDGWVATVDGTSGFVFVQGFSFHRGQDYPEGTSVQYWTNGLGRIKAWGRTIQMPADIEENPHLVESELIGPYAKLSPGDESLFDYEWRACSIGGDYPILSCNRFGCTAQSFRVLRTYNGRHRILGRFGIFSCGIVRIVFKDPAAMETKTSLELATAVTPLNALILDDLFGELRIPDNAKYISIVLYSSEGCEIGEIAQTAVGDL